MTPCDLAKLMERSRLRSKFDALMNTGLIPRTVLGFNVAGILHSKIDALSESDVHTILEIMEGKNE